MLQDGDYLPLTPAASDDNASVHTESADSSSDDDDDGEEASSSDGGDAEEDGKGCSAASAVRGGGGGECGVPAKQHGKEAVLGASERLVGV